MLFRLGQLLLFIFYIWLVLWLLDQFDVLNTNVWGGDADPEVGTVSIPQIPQISTDLPDVVIRDDNTITVPREVPAPREITTRRVGDVIVYDDPHTGRSIDIGVVHYGEVSVSSAQCVQFYPPGTTVNGKAVDKKEIAEQFGHVGEWSDEHAELNPNNTVTVRARQVTVYDTPCNQ